MAAETTTTTAGITAPAAAPQPHPLVSFTPIIVVCAILYFLVIRPQQKQTKEHKKMVDAIKPGDRVLTQGGLFGTVAGIKAGSVFLKIADNVKVEVSRAAVSQVIIETSHGAPAGSAEQPVG